QDVWKRKLRFYASPRWRAAVREPSIPHGIHLVECADILEPNCSCKKPVLARSSFCQQRVDMLEDRFGLARDTRYRLVRCHLPCQIDDILEHHDVAHTRAGLQPVDSQMYSPFIRSGGCSPPKRGNTSTRVGSVIELEHAGWPLRTHISE